MAYWPIKSWAQQGGAVDTTSRLETRLRRLERGDAYLRGGSNVFPSGDFGSVLNSALSNGKIDPRNKGFIAKGTNSGVVFPVFTSTVTDTSITWAWSGALRRVDGSAVGITASSLAVTGLSSSTKYYFYPFFATRGCGVGFVAGNAGSPAFAHTTDNDAAVQQQSLQDREPLSLGAMYATTSAAGGATTTGYGGGSTGHIVAQDIPGGCPRDYMVVESQSRGVVRCNSLQVGEMIASPEGWTEITQLKLTPCDAFVCIRTDAGDEIEISPETPQPLLDGSDCHADMLSLAMRVLVRQPGGGSGYIHGLDWVEAEGGMRAVISCEPEHRFWCGRHSPVIAAHNILKRLL